MEREQKKGLESIHLIKEYIYADKTQLNENDILILKELDKVQNAYVDLFCKYAAERMGLKGEKNE